MTMQAESITPPQPHVALVEALRLLGKRRLVLAIHDSSFPSREEEEIGRGTPYSEGAKAFLAFARGLGFDAIQFGPQGQMTRDNPSPYDGTLFSRNILNLDLAGLAKGEKAWLSRKTFERLVEKTPLTQRTFSEHAYAFDTAHRALEEIHRRFSERREAGDEVALSLDQELAEFSARERDWLYPDALYHVLAAEQNWRHHRDWRMFNKTYPEQALYRLSAERPGFFEDRHALLLNRHQHAIERYRLGQYLLHQQHAMLRSLTHRYGLRIYGDLQIGFSACDQWSRGMLYLQNYHMGAPPSRTNPKGQPWGYGVLDPAQYHGIEGAPGPVLKLLTARLNQLLAQFDGLRIDHPHGLICPWVYRTHAADPHQAVQQGARLFSSPNLTDHPHLAQYAITRPEQLNKALPRYADNWVSSLDPYQIDRYAVLMDTLISAVQTQGGTIDDVLCEVLSTLPYPLERILERYGLGRFRVTQKADLDNPADVYRSENAKPKDWIMVGNHDTPPIWRLARQWLDDGRARQQADYLAWRLAPEGERESFANEIVNDPRKLIHAKLADIFASPAEHVMIFFSDLFGSEEIYNRPGVIHPDNWRLRIAPDYADAYPQATARGEALNLPFVLALALRAKGKEFAASHGDLIDQLLRLGGWRGHNLKARTT
ncbi:MAG: 4-alpha-glucanotransferase [Candidatus Thiodiazotropha sp.]|jgi:4-alpha-glucanotransferase